MLPVGTNTTYETQLSGCLQVLCGGTVDFSSQFWQKKQKDSMLKFLREALHQLNVQRENNILHPRLPGVF